MSLCVCIYTNIFLRNRKTHTLHTYCVEDQPTLLLFPFTFSFCSLHLLRPTNRRYNFSCNFIVKTNYNYKYRLAMDGNGNRQLEVHYINSGFSYTASESFMDFFDGIPHQATHYSHSGPMHGQENAYWSMNMSSYKYVLPSAHGNIPYYDPYEVHNYVPRMDLNRSAWEFPVMMNVTEPSSTDAQSAENSVPTMQAIPEECSPNDDSASSSQVVWQDDIDLDNMTYEELLDLGEAIGTESRGLSLELIGSLPTTRYKSGGFFLRKKSGERCVICQMRYKRGDRQINLPCKHVYHTECGSKWLTINKTCPICNMEVLGESIQFKTLEQAYRKAGYIRLVYTLDSRHKSTMDATNRFKFLTRGTNRINGAAENPTANNRSSIFAGFWGFLFAELICYGFVEEACN
ncbi:hypothetical protein L1987_86273 [Smallanthus sonchifolius]|uniref:Uncharacterized protein n=1 Tax=Smallanthus sonchifolius TaxID=185202 RepID=A0ACB8XZH8_9ASTR|nr:hypothetical protein L1987_86273 [Smallanthus sonchifolius]